MSRHYAAVLVIGAMTILSICQQDMAKWATKNKKLISPVEYAKGEIMKR